MKKLFTRLFAVLFVLLMVTGQLFASSDINGSVLYHFKQNKPIPSVNLDLIDGNGNVVATTETALNGTYNFPNVPYGTYTLHANTSISAGGVTMGDALLMFFHLCNIYPFSPIQELAADVDGNGDVTWNDYWTVLVGWFIQGYPFPAGPWIFDDLTFEHTGAKTNVPVLGGSSSGDVNGTFVPSTRDIPALDVEYSSQSVANEFTVGIYAKDITEASAMGLVINYPESMISISTVECQLGEINQLVENGTIRVSYINQLLSTTSVDSDRPILTIKGATTAAYDGSEINFELSPVSHFCDATGEQIGTRYTLPKLMAVESHLGTNYPNPFKESTQIDYILPADGKVTINLFNQQGQLVKTLVSNVETAGSHSIQFNAEGLQSGIYYYNLSTDGSQSINETKRMIITR
ncbi:MAG: T9SS type A sorting domain-containing protein [Lentimicrobium sp.]|jgi:hypothetical protein|nr:T9SS type A sorting domain-containing protein [Lentimicrobium sp.]